jgi:pectin methylesterase-like acyl-CoA thioesterase
MEPLPRFSTKRFLIGSSLVVILLVMGVSAAAAADLYVNDATGNDGNNCTSAATPCKTIQAAINKASPNDTIHVAAGTYPESAPGPLTVDKTLTLQGEQFDVDARTRVGPESIVTDPQGRASAPAASSSTVHGAGQQRRRIHRLRDLA